MEKYAYGVCVSSKIASALTPDRCSCIRKIYSVLSTTQPHRPTRAFYGTRHVCYCVCVCVCVGADNVQK